jgi:hypothetical protein
MQVPTFISLRARLTHFPSMWVLSRVYRKSTHGPAHRQLAAVVRFQLVHQFRELL